MKIRRYIFGSVLALALVAAPAVVFAIVAPDSFNIITAQGYGDVDESGDILLLVHYDIVYASLPDELASEAVMLRYLDNGSPVRASSPFVFVTSGYNQGVIAVYFDAADAVAFSLTHGDADSAELIGNPSLFTDPWKTSQPITWATKGSQLALETALAELALTLEEQVEWDGVNLIQFDSGANILQAEGEDYLENTIPRLRQMAPNLFAANFATPTFDERTFTQSYQTSLEGAWDNSRLSGSFTGLSDWTGMPETAITTTIVIIGALVLGGLLATFVMKQGVSTESAGGLALFVGVILMGLAAFQGLMNLTVLAVIGFFGLMLIASILWLKRA